MAVELIIIAIVAIIDIVACLVMNWSAQIVVSLIPGIAGLTFIQALLTPFFWHWAFYVNPTVASVVFFVFFFIVLVVKAIASNSKSD